MYNTNMHYIDIKESVKDECIKLGKSPDSILLLPVSKASTVEEIRKVYSQGARDFAENRPDILFKKATELDGYDIYWHFIGNIQSRRIRDIVTYCELIHSIEKITHVRKIDLIAREIGKIQKVLIEVNISGEECKGGISVSQLPDFLIECKDFENVQVCGLMCMAPFQAKETTQNQVFKGLSDALFTTREYLGKKKYDYKQLSMGMSNDWRIALACGSTILRIGTAIFSD